MSKHITLKGIPQSPVLSEHIDKHIEKIEHFLQEHKQSPLSIEILVEVHPNHAHNKVEIRITAPQYTVIAHRVGQDVYQLFTQVASIAYKKLLEDKDKLNNKHNKERAREREIPFSRVDGDLDSEE